MTLTEAAKQILTGQKPLIDVWHYLVGNYRYKLYYSIDDCAMVRGARKRHPLMRQHIWEQINYRITYMNKECYIVGSCIKCGCNTTHLQMSSKPCKGLEYPPMMNARDWARYTKSRHNPEYKGYAWVYVNKKKPLLFKEEKTIMFQLTQIDFGNVTVGDELDLKFPYNGDIQSVKKLISPCTCTGVNNDPIQKAIVGKYKVQPIPMHLQMDGIKTQEKEMNITVDYINTDGTEGTQQLTFKATINE